MTSLKIFEKIKNSYAFLEEDDIQKKLIQALMMDDDAMFFSMLVLKSRRQFADTATDDRDGLKHIVEHFAFNQDDILIIQNADKDFLRYTDESDILNTNLFSFCAIHGKANIFNKLAEYSISSGANLISSALADTLITEILSSEFASSFIRKPYVFSALMPTEYPSPDLDSDDPFAHYSGKSKWLASTIIGFANRGFELSYKLDPIHERTVELLIDHKIVSAQDVLDAAEYIKACDQILPAIKPDENPLTENICQLCQSRIEADRLLHSTGPSGLSIECHTTSSKKSI